MAHENYVYRILHRPASRARALINGVPIYDRVVEKNVAPSGPITHWLRRGENVITVELYPTPRSPLTPLLDAHFGIAILPAEDLDRKVFVWEYPDSLVEAKLPTELPLVHAGIFTVTQDLPVPAYLRASAEDFPVEGTPAQHAAVAELHQAFAGRDAAGFQSAMDLKITEFDRFYGPQPGARADALARMNEPWVMEPFDAEDLRFDRYLDGRLAFVRRASGKPAVRAVHRDEPYLGWGQDFFMTRLDGRWRIFW
jgi:hypothetical protein